LVVGIIGIITKYGQKRIENEVLLHEGIRRSEERRKQGRKEGGKEADWDSWRPMTDRQIT
jgi:hypothetical protein